ncbi:MAG TPA: cellulose synthase subunit BcsC-related outer membrane protein, partial [Gallionella sp.]|nr:cellulose synthase subunit BcsC-related outer membrane protein [Gallionella sp.]
AELPRYAQLMSAWARLQLGEATMAADRFLALYRQSPDEESAQGILNSFSRAGRENELESFAHAEPLASMVHKYYARKWFDEKRFLAARAQYPAEYGDSGAVAAPQVTSYLASRAKSGTDGLSRLNIKHTPIVEAGWAAGPSGEVRLRLDRVYLDSGNPAPAALLGSQSGGMWNFMPTTSMRGMEPRLAWRDESAHKWEAEIGLTPTGGEIAARPVGYLLHQRNIDTGSYLARLYNEPVRESILSYTGLRDPHSGAKWGRVTRAGAKLSTQQRLDGEWSASGSISREYLNGSGVESNSRAGFDADIGKNMGLTGFEHAVVGFSVGFERYRKNLSQFTLGHGGYFSPQHFWHYGPSFGFMTQENRQFIIKGRLAVGGVYKREDTTQRFPFAPDGNFYAASNGSGRSHNAEMSGVWRLNDHMQLGGMISKRYAPQYNDISAIVFLRILLEPRKSVLSADMPTAITENLY